MELSGFEPLTLSIPLRCHSWLRRFPDKTFRDSQ
jgi:hypothetical protein